jgi:hypothetical protein
MTNSSTHSQNMEICFQTNSTMEIAQSFCRLASVNKCQDDQDDALQFQCFITGVTCVLPPKQSYDTQNGY